MKTKFDYDVFIDPYDNSKRLVLNYNKWKNKLDEIPSIIETETEFERYTISEKYIRYYPKHEVLDDGGGYVLDETIVKSKGAIKVYVVEEVKND